LSASLIVIYRNAQWYSNTTISSNRSF